MDTFCVKDLSDYIINKINFLSRSKYHSEFFQQISLFNFRIKCNKKGDCDSVNVILNENNENIEDNNTVNIIYDRNKMKMIQNNALNKFINGIEEKTVWNVMENIKHGDSAEEKPDNKIESQDRKRKIVIKHLRNFGTSPSQHFAVSLRDAETETKSKHLKPSTKDEKLMTDSFKTKTITRYTNTNPKRIEQTYQMLDMQKKEHLNDKKSKNTVQVSRSIQAEPFNMAPNKPCKFKSSIWYFFRIFRMKKSDKSVQSHDHIHNYSKKVVCELCKKKFKQKFPYTVNDKDQIAKDLSETLRLLIKMEAKQNTKYFQNILNELCQQRNDINCIINMYKAVLDVKDNKIASNTKAYMMENSIQVIQAARNRTSNSSLDLKLHKDVLNAMEKIKSTQSLQKKSEKDENEDKKSQTCFNCNTGKQKMATPVILKITFI